jgi:succinate dehydrogenase/fumarate reductase cytochrome b subunit
MFKYLNHYVISKYVMAFSGAYLLLFITAHLIGNMQYYLIGRETFNAVCEFFAKPGRNTVGRKDYINYRSNIASL